MLWSSYSSAVKEGSATNMLNQQSIASTLRWVGTGVCLLNLFTTVMWAQGSTAQINGTVSDSSGLAVPGADVKVTQTATGAVRTATSGPDGAFVFPNLPIGPYM